MKLHLPVRLLQAIMLLSTVVTYSTQAASVSPIPEGFTESTVTDFSQIKGNEGDSYGFIASSDITCNEANQNLVSDWSATEWFITSESTADGDSKYGFSIQNTDIQIDSDESISPMGAMFIEMLQVDGMKEVNIKDNSLKVSSSSVHIDGALFDTTFRLYKDETTGKYVKDPTYGIYFMNNGAVVFSGNSAYGESKENWNCRVGGSALSGTVYFSGNGNITYSDNIVTAANNAYSAERAEAWNKQVNDLHDEYLASPDAFDTKYGPGSGNRLKELWTLYERGDLTYESQLQQVGSIPSIATGGVHYGIGITYSGNGDITFTNNGATATGETNEYEARGGALHTLGSYTSEGYGVTLNDNGNIIFSGNYAAIDFTGDDTSIIKKSDAEGGAIYVHTGKLQMQNNDDILFEKNYIKNDDKYQLQSIYATDEAGTRYDTLDVKISAKEGKTVEFRDSVSLHVNWEKEIVKDGISTTYSSSLDLNSQYIDAEGNTIAQTGDIVITGEYAEQHLNEILAAHGENRTATADEILASRTSEVEGTAKLHDGRMLLKEGVVMNVDEIEVKSSVSGQSTPTLALQNATLNTDTLTFEKGTSLEIDSNSTLNVSEAMTMAKGSSLKLRGNFKAGDTIVSGTGDIDISEASITLANGMGAFAFDENGALIITAVFDNSIAEALTVTNWGIATASRTFVNAVRGQRTNTGCIADGRGTAWAAVLGATSDIGSGDVDLKGAAVGADMKVGEKSSLGMAFGYIDGDAKIPGMSKAEQEGTYVALYGEHGLKKLSATSCLSLDWVAAYGQTDTEWESADWEQQSLQLNTRLNWNKKVTDRLCMSVFGGLEYFTSTSDRVENAKTGSIQNLRGEIGVGARYVAWGTPGSEAVTDEKGATIAAARPGCEKLVLHGEIRYMNDMVRSNPVIEQDGIRDGGSDNPGRQGMGIEAGATYRISERWSASANYGFNTMEDSKEHRVNVGASYTF